MLEYWCGDVWGNGHLRDLPLHEITILKLIFINVV